MGDDMTELPDLKNSNLVFFPSMPPNDPIDDELVLQHLLDKEDVPQDSINWSIGTRLYDTSSVSVFFSFIEENEIPEYPNDIPCVSEPVNEGKAFDVLSMLSNSASGRDFLVRNNGDQVPVQSLEGKHILVCCVFLPILTQSHGARECFDIKSVYSQLIVERPDEFEMVIVAKMRRDWVKDEADFQHFFSAFPCLAIPFWDLQSRDCVFKSLVSDNPMSWPSILIVDPKQTVLRYNNVRSLFRDYGASSFPFTDERIDLISREAYEMILRIDNTIRGIENSIPNLDDLLCLKPSDVLNKSGENGCVSVLDLSKKLVALYLCYDGRFLSTINFFQQKCKAKGLEIEIVLVYLPYTGDVKWFQSRINATLAKYEICWWVLPFNDIVSRRLSRLTPNDHDKVMILGPNSSYFDTLGLEIMCCYGIKAYPFARASMIDRNLARLRSLTLDLLLIMPDGQNYVLNKDGDRVPVSELFGRNIILYIDQLNPHHDEQLYDQLVKWYPELKVKDPDFEVVFFSIDRDADVKVSEPYYVMPWLTFPFPSGHSAYIISQLFLEWEAPYPSLIAFGKDGRIRSTWADEHLIRCGIDAFPFEDHLREELDPNFDDLKTCFD